MAQGHLDLLDCRCFFSHGSRAQVLPDAVDEELVLAESADAAGALALVESVDAAGALALAESADALPSEAAGAAVADPPTENVRT